MSSSQSAGGSRDARRGALFGLLAAALFGVSAPLAKRLLGEMTPQILAGLLYLGAGIALSAWRALRPMSREAPLTRRDVPALAGIVIAGGILGPLLMLIGLQRVNAVAGSLLLNLEGPFTIALAVLLFREHLGKRSVIAALLIFAGAAVLKLETGEAALDPWGAAAIATACFAWALDNNLTQRISLRDPIAIVRIKALVAGSFNLALGLALAHHATSGLPSMSAVVGACVLGAFSHGVSVVLDAYALRLIGAAREAMYFATAPFVGAIAATWIVGEALRPVDIVAMCSMALGVAALVRERHSHRHTHEPIEHDHLHVHDEHHQHAHRADITTAEPHAHAHKHDALVHSHPHAPDAHHRHRH